MVVIRERIRGDIVVPIVVGLARGKELLWRWLHVVMCSPGTILLRTVLVAELDRGVARARGPVRPLEGTGIAPCRHR